MISDGALKGFVIINPRWAAFTADDYRNACASVYMEGHVFPDSFQIEVNEGDFDFRGFQVARAELFNVRDKTSISFTTSTLNFSAGCLKKMPKVIYVELLIHPELKLLAVRPSAKISKNAIKWCVLKETDHQPRYIGGKAFLPKLFELLDWNTNCKYSVRGERLSNDTEAFMLFRMTETEVTYRDKPPDSDNTVSASTAKVIRAFPLHWTASFGDEYYRKAQIREMLNLTNNKAWNTTAEGIPYVTEELAVTQPSVLEAEIDSMIDNNEKADDNHE